jgi:hypothetical protein
MYGTSDGVVRSSAVLACTYSSMVLLTVSAFAMPARISSRERGGRVPASTCA